MRPTRRLIASGLALTGMAVAGGRAAARSSVEDMGLGSLNAPVSVLAYLSPTCPGCAKWYGEQFPAFKARYIDTGKVRFSLREAMIHGPVDAAVFLMARCAGADRYFSVIELAMRALPDLQANPTNMRQWVYGAGEAAGLSQAEIDRCIHDEAALVELNERYERQMEEFEVEYAPLFVINRTKYEGMRPPTVDELAAVIDPLLRS